MRSCKIPLKVRNLAKIASNLQFFLFMNPDDAYNYCKLFPFHSLQFLAVEDRFSFRDWRTHMVRAPLKPGVIVADPHAQFPFSAN